MPDKLTDSEIVKALRSWLEEIRIARQEYLEKVNVEHYPSMRYEYLLSDTINEINRLQAENEKWQGGYMTQKQEIANLEIEFKAMRGAANSYKAENEKLKADCENYKQVAEHQQSVTVQRGFEIKRLKEKVERLQAENERLKSCVKIEKEVREIAKRTMEPLVKEITREQIDIAVKLAKTVAYTDFAESLKKDFDNPHIQKFGLDFVKFLKGVVDNRLKEMVGDTDV